jgi:hypothetical protein
MIGHVERIEAIAGEGEIDCLDEGSRGEIIRDHDVTA